MKQSCSNRNAGSVVSKCPKEIFFYVFNGFLAYYLNSRYSANLINYSTKEQVLDILPTFIVSFIVASVMWSISFLAINLVLQLLLQCVVGSSLALLVYERLQLEEYKEVKGIVLSLIKR